MSSYDITNWYWTVNDVNPSTSVYKSVTASFVPLNDAGFLAFLAQTSFPPEERQNQPILSAANNGSGNTRLRINTTQVAPFQMTTGMVVQVNGTGSYDGPHAITVIDATHIDIAVAFAGNATGTIIYATIIDTQAHLASRLNDFNTQQWATYQQEVSLTLNVNTTLSLSQIAKLIVITNTSGANIDVTLPPLAMLGMPGLGSQLLIQNNSSGNSVLTIKDSLGVARATKMYPGTVAIMSPSLLTLSAYAEAWASLFPNNNSYSPWIAFTPTFTPDSGSINATINDAYFWRDGASIRWRVNASIAVTSGAPTSITMTLPQTLAGSPSNRQYVGTGKEVASTNKMFSLTAAAASSVTDNIQNYDGTNVLIAAAHYIMQGMYETT